MPKEWTPEMREAARQRAADRRAKKEAEKLAATMDEPSGEFVPAPGGQWDEPAETEIIEAEPAPADPFEVFLAGLDAETRELLDEAEIRVIFEAQVKKAEEERRAEKKKALTAKALQAARVRAGLIPERTLADEAWKARMEEMVTFRVELPMGDDGALPDIGIRMDGKIYYHGVRYTLPRGVFESLREICYRAQDGWLMFEGKSKRARQQILYRDAMAGYHLNMEGRA